MVGSQIAVRTQDFSDTIALGDHKVRYVVRYAEGRDVLDLGCVQHNPQVCKSRYTLNPWYWRMVVQSIRHLEVPNDPEHTSWHARVFVR